MQAHPQSNSAARMQRTHSISRPITSTTHSQQSLRVPPNSGSPVAPNSQQLAQTAGLAHDAGNLLQALGLYCELLGLPGVLRPEHSHYAAELTLISNRSAELIRRLLALPSAAAPTPDRAAPDMPSSRANPHPADILRDITPILQSIASGAANVTVTCAASLAYVDFPSQITAEIVERIAVNLVRNATEAIRKQRDTSPSLPPRSEIRVAFAVVAGRLQLTVEDTGPGMPPAVAAAFLQPSPLPIGAKRGLGHRIVHELATGSGGQISVRVRPGNGTLFSIKWPLHTIESHHLASKGAALTS